MFKVFEDEATAEQFREMDKKEIQKFIEQSFLFSAIWSLCISVDTKDRRGFSDHFKKICNGEIDGVPKLKNKILPTNFDRGTIYDYCFIPQTNEWKSWIDFTNKDELDNFPKGSIV
jgi:hypothetical protein